MLDQSDSLSNKTSFQNSEELEKCLIDHHFEKVIWEIFKYISRKPENSLSRTFQDFGSFYLFNKKYLFGRNQN